MIPERFVARFSLHVLSVLTSAKEKKWKRKKKHHPHNIMSVVGPKALAAVSKKKCMERLNMVNSTVM